MYFQELLSSSASVSPVIVAFSYIILIGFSERYSMGFMLCWRGLHDRLTDYRRPCAGEICNTALLSCCSLVKTQFTRDLPALVDGSGALLSREILAFAAFGERKG
jgi:hypothetical protein